MLNQAADGEIGGIALAGVSEGSSQVVVGKRGIRQRLAMITTPLKNGLDELLVLPGQPAKQDRHVIALFGGKGTLSRPTEMLTPPSKSSYIVRHLPPSSSFHDLLSQP